MIRFSDDRKPTKDQVIDLYRSVSWSSADKPDALHNGLLASHSLVTAWDADALVGLGNAISDGEWRPADNLPMPYHHATRLELTNIAAFPSLAKHRDVRVRLTIDITSRDIRKVPNRNEWRATYAARIVRACVPPAAGSN